VKGAGVGGRGGELVLAEVGVEGSSFEGGPGKLLEQCQCRCRMLHEG
jgi:hypothetical protein